MLAWAVMGMRAAAAVGVLLIIVGGMPRVVQAGLAAVFGLWVALVMGPPAAALGIGAAGAGAAGAGAAGAGAFAPGTLLAAAGAELALGAALGLVAAVPLVAARMAGQLVDIAGQQKTYATLFGVLAAAVFVGVNGHVAVVSAIVDSHARLPVFGAAAIVGVRATVVGALAALVPAAVRLSIPWLVTVAVVQVAIGAGVRVAGRAGAHTPTAAAVPAALAMMTAALISTFAIAVAALIRG
ncbi:MAG: flagellar biosynthetic protein FliR [Deltaproteobacteria bacterium]|nr:flagellar biosynthetic protein FliR [Deltaproteobacteria bacterium]